MPPVKTSGKGCSPESDTPKQRKRPGRVPVSCAECRRLKLRCDRKVPCETCLKRGCAALCPDGALITGGKGTRQAVADVEDLKKKIDQLQSRNNALESALKTIQAAVSDEPHPLINDSSIMQPLFPFCQSTSSTDSANDVLHLTADEEDVLDAFGTLTLGLRGETRFFGQTSRSEYLIHAPEPLATSEDSRYPRLIKEIVDEANKELDVPCRSQEVGNEMMKLLPPLSQACQLCETFLEFGKFVWYPLPRQYVFDDIVGTVYQSWKDKTVCNIAMTHQLALMWMIYALATLYDQKKPPYSVEAHEYYLLARLSLRFAPPAHDTTLIAIQTMIYMAQFLELSDCEPAHTQSHKAWMQIGHAVKLGHSIGLHVSSNRWRLGDETSTQRNRVFWQLFFQDTWLSFGFGRPPSINMAFVDCEMPKEPEVTVGCSGLEQDKREIGFHIWTWQYTKLLHSIMATAFGNKAPNYAKVMELDRRVRDFPVPAALRVQCGAPENPPPTTALALQRLLGTLLKETTLLNLHRPYFSQALSDMPSDPLRHRYGPSVMAIYRSAWRILTGARCSYKAIPGIASRLGMLWSYALAGGIVMCLLVIRAPVSNLARSSLSELDKLCELFEEASTQSQIASNNMAVVRKLRKQAHDAMNKTPGTEDTARIHTELDRLGGKTHLICPTAERKHVCSERVSPPKDMYEPLVQPEMIHPTIMQDMRTFDVDGQGDIEFNMDLPPTTFDPAQMMDFTVTGFPDFYFTGTGTNSSSSSGSSPDIQWINGHGASPVAQMQSPMGMTTNGPPVLDATWQAFVEQLGF